MAPKYYCPCFQCENRSTYITQKTLKGHFKKSQARVTHLKATGAPEKKVKHAEACLYKLTELLGKLEGSHARLPGQSGSSDPHGKHLISYNPRDYLLICFDLADAPVASHPFSEGELSDNEGPHAEQSGSSYSHGKHLICYDLEIIC